MVNPADSRVDRYEKIFKTRRAMNNLLLSIVIPAKNEEDNISRCLDSVTQAASRIDHEIILVDCCSKDRTIAVASRYPVKILELLLTGAYPSAARYIALFFRRGSLFFSLTRI